MKIKKNIFMLILFLLAADASSVFASGISIHDYLSSAFTDSSLVFQEEKVSFLKKSLSRTPIINEIELRAKVEDFDDIKKSYTVRVKPNGLDEIVMGNKANDTTLRYNIAKLELLKNNALKDRYHNVIDYMYTRQRIELNRKLIVLYTDRINVLNRSINSLNFDAKDLIEAEDDMIQIKIDMIELENKIVELEDEINGNIGWEQDIAFNSDRIASIRDIEERVSMHPGNIPNRNIHLVSSELSFKLAENNYNLEKAGNKRFINFIEASYDHDLTEWDAKEKAFSVGLGIKLPIVNPNKLETHKKRLELFQEKSNYENRQKEIAEEQVRLLRDLKRLIKQYYLLIGKKEGGSSETSFKKFRKVEGVNPLILLKLKESSLKTDISLEKVKFQIYTKYINLLDASGRLSKKPFNNYLYRGLEMIAP